MAERTERARPRPPRTRKVRAEELPWCKFYWRDWMSNADVRRLSHDQRGRLMDVHACTWGSTTPGVMTEDDVRAWAGFSAEEWKRARAVFEPLFNTTKRRGKWVLPAVIEEMEAAERAFEARREVARKGVEARRAKSAGGSELPTGGSPQVALGLEPGVQPGVAPAVQREIQRREVQTTEFQRTAVPDPRLQPGSTQRQSTPAPAVAVAGGTAATPAELLERVLRTPGTGGTGNATEGGA